MADALGTLQESDIEVRDAARRALPFLDQADISPQDSSMECRPRRASGTGTGRAVDA